MGARVGAHSIRVAWRLSTPSSVAQCLADWLRTKTELEMVHPLVPALDRLMGQIRPHPPDELAVSILTSMAHLWHTPTRIAA